MEYRIKPDKNQYVRTTKIESGTGILISRNKFAELIMSDTAIKLSNEFELIVQSIDEGFVKILFKGKNDPDWNKWVDVTEEFFQAMNS